MNKVICKNHCSNCSAHTNQTTVFFHKEHYTSEIIRINESGSDKKSLWAIQESTWEISKCNGCERLNLNVTTRNLPSDDILKQFIYPQKTIRNIPHWIFELPINYVELFTEVYCGINNNLLRLSLMGSRLIIETFMLAKVGDIGTFKQKLNQLEKLGLIGKIQKDYLESALDAGNAASHRGYNPTIEVLNKIMDIIENLLQSEILVRHSETIKNETPQRNS